MLAKSIRFRFGVGVGFRFRLSLSSGCLSSEFPPVVMFLNGEGSGQQALKGLLVECRVGPIRGHGIGGREIAETDAIVVQVWAVSNDDNLLTGSWLQFHRCRVERIAR
jgi:hypothetical protein